LTWRLSVILVEDSHNLTLFGDLGNSNLET